MPLSIEEDRDELLLVLSQMIKNIKLGEDDLGIMMKLGVFHVWEDVDEGDEKIVSLCERLRELPLLYHGKPKT